ncbi:hypothetical protein ACWEIJ_20250 [Lentzea sp. NPDC004789]
MDFWGELPAAAEAMSDAGHPRRAANHLLKALRGKMFAADPSAVPVRPVVLAPERRSVLNAATRHLVALIHRVCWSLTGDPAELASRVGLAPGRLPLLCAGGVEHEIEYSGRNVRPDVVLSGGRPVFLECNFGAANGDPISLHPLSVAYRELYGPLPDPVPGELPEPFAGRLALYRKICAERDVPQSVAVVGTTRNETLVGVEYFEGEAEYLRAHGFESVFVEPDRFGAAGRRFSIALKHFQSDSLARSGFSLDELARAHAETVFMVSDSGQSLSSKLVLAWLSSGEVALPERDREFVREHVPWTRRVERGEVEYRGRSSELTELITGRPDEFVLKPLNSAGGQGVLIGRDTDPGAWRQRVERAAELRDHVVQAHVEADPLQMDFFDTTTGEARRTAVSYVLGPYVVDGINSGCSIRHAPKAGDRVVNYGHGASFNVVF